MTSRVAAAVAACMLGLGFAGVASAAAEGTLINAAESKQHDAALKLLAGWLCAASPPKVVRRT